MNTRCEAVETAIKNSSSSGLYDCEESRSKRAEIIVVKITFHGTYNGFCFYVFKTKSTSVDSVPMLWHLVILRWFRALKAAITPNTAAFILEPIQGGEAGIKHPPAGYLKEGFWVCKKKTFYL